MRCHYVPQFYLKNFSIEENSDKVYAYRRNKEPFVAGINSIAAKKDLYVFIDKLTGKKNSEVEEMFSYMEGSVAPIIKNIINGTALIELTNEEHNILSEFVSFLHVRNLGFREKQKNIASSLISWDLKVLAQDEVRLKKALLETGHHNEDIKKIKDYALNFDDHFSVGWGRKNDDYFLRQSLLLGLNINQIIFKKDWHVLENETSRAFITSDNPVTLIRPENLPPFYGSGIANSHIVIPLAPRKALLLRNEYKKIAKPTVIKVNREFVQEVNDHIMFYAHKFIYSNYLSNDFKMGFNMTEDGDSERVITG
jgi:hypothetical protein